MNRKVQAIMNKRKDAISDFLFMGAGIGCIILVVMTSRLVMALEGDNCAQTYALFANVAKALHSGEVSLWNPYLWGGFPNTGHFITESCYPINWILCNLFYDQGTGLVSYAVIPCNLIFHLCVYFSGMYCLLKKIGFSRLNSFSVGVTSALCCSVFSYMYWLVYLDGFAWLPFLILCAVTMFEAEAERKYFYSVLLGGLFAVEALVSISLMLVISVFLFGILFVVHLSGNDRRHILCNVKCSVLAGGLGILLAAPLLLSTLTFMKYMVRYVPDVGYVAWGMKLPIEEYTKYVCEPNEIWQMLQFRNHALNRVSVSAFVLLFCAIGLFCRQKKKKRIYYISFFGFAVCLLACFGILFPAAFYYIPGLNQLREAIMYGIFVNMFAGILAAYGFDAVERFFLQKTELKKSGGRAVLASVAAAVLLLYNILTGAGRCILFAGLAFCYLLLLAVKQLKRRRNLLCLCTLLFAGMCVKDVYDVMDTYAFTEPEAVEMVEEACKNSELLVEYVERLDPDDTYYRMTGWGNTAVYPENMASVLGFYDVKGYLNPSLEAGVNIHTILPLNKKAQLQNIKYFLVSGRDNQDTIDSFEHDAGFRRVGEIDGIYSDWAGTSAGTVLVYQAVEQLGDAWVVSDYGWNDTESQKEILQGIADGTLDIGSRAVIEPCGLNEREQEYVAAINKKASPGSAVCQDVSNNRICYEVNTGTSGILVTSEIYYPGWEVYVNGERGTVLQVDGTNRGVVVPEGDSRVEFRYRPLEVRIGAILQLGALAGICGYVFRRWHRR